MFIARKLHLTSGFVRHLSLTCKMPSDAGAILTNLGDMRKPYNAGHDVFTEADLVAKEPFAQFKDWFDLACQTPGIQEANAMCLAAATKEGRPSARYVLLKGYNEQDGFVFFTNYSSRKGKELEENPYAALTFYWEPLKRSVRIEGKVSKITSEQSEEYFQSRPKGSQIGACVSHQSQLIPSRQTLTDNEERLIKEYADENKTVPRPDCWGGYSVIPEFVEFWQGQSTRLHDRIRFRRLNESEKPDEILTHAGDNNWVYERLAP